MKPGEIILYGEDIACNVGRDTVEVEVTNTGDRPVQIGSHYHFFEINSELAFDRDKAFGYRLNIPAGTAVRFEPQDKKTVELVALAGERRVFGLNNKTNGSLD
ncbi:urease subunit beta [Listeria booriae]|uniref:urease subunit beta n=1 Tax=Listeria booriae TaxID=1552123 RepID=UPI0016286E5A|nr:urease subunit beta [Listeria booriae]MBC1905598.1 urease subunit beta [Listeria booriae]MBC2099308.1 urease subunit beta [Listeria booriae]